MAYKVLCGMALTCLGIAVARDEDGKLPDFSSFQYTGAPPGNKFRPSYDFCIVGGGTAGLVLANRLSESGKHTVGVFEAGGTPEDAATHRAAGGNAVALNGGWSPVDYNFKTVPQVHMNNRSFEYHRGRTLGGSSVINGLYYGLGSSSIYDQWEAEGNPGWNWKTIHAAAKRGTTFVGNPDNTNDPTFMTFDPDNYGTDGPLKIGFQGRVVTSGPSFMKALSAIDVHPVRDLNGGNGIGVKQGTMTLDENFMRSSSYDSYYMQARGRANLDVLYRAIVVRIIFDDKDTYGSDEVRATGITWIDNKAGVFHNTSCTNEVIISGGAFHSPFILKQSGIGPQAELEDFGIEPVVVNENVGMNMEDHTSFSVVHAVKPEFAAIASTEDLFNNVRVMNEEQRAFYQGGEARWRSKWSAPSGCTNGFQKLSEEELRSFGAGDIIDSGRGNQAHNEFLYESVWYPQSSDIYGIPQPNTSYVSVTASNMAALSVGSVTLGSAYYSSDPLINPNYLAEEADQKMAVQAIKYMRKIWEHPEMQQWSAGEVSPGPEVQSDEELLEYAKNTMIPNWHASNTCRMLPREKGGVIDSRLRVYGTKGLRVCDVSIFPRLPDVNLVGPVYAAAELGAEIIRRDHGDL